MPQFDFSEFSRQSPKGIIVNYFVILFRVLKASWALLLLLLTRDEINWNLISMGVGAILVFVLIIAALQFWFFTFKIEGDQFLVKKGVIKKSNLSIAFERIQNINFKQNIVQQVINVTQVEIETAGAKTAEVSIKALSREQAEAMKAFIMSHQVESNHEAIETIDQTDSKPIVLLKIALSDLFKVSLTENHLRSLAILLSLFFSLGYQFEEIAERMELDTKLDTFLQENTTAVLGSIYLISMIVIFLLIVAVLVSTVRTFLTHFDLKVLIRNKALEISQGLLTKRNFILKKEKVQYIVISTNPLKRLLGIYNILFRQASSGGSDKTKKQKQIRIVGSKASQNEQLKTVLFDNKEAESLESHWPDKFYIVIMALRTSLFWACFNIFLYFNVEIFYVVLINAIGVPLAVGLIWLKYKKSYFKVDREMLIKSAGQIETHIIYFEFHKLQGLKVRQSIFQKRRGVVNLVLQTSSGKIQLPYIKEDQANHLYNYIIYKVETSRKKWI